MRMLAALTVAVSLLAMAVPAGAHHAFSAEFDVARPITLKGVVTEIEWVNPHSWIHIDVKGPDGKVQSWMIEAGPPGALVRRGWSKASVPPGLEVLVEGYQAKDGSLRANGRDVTLPDGRRLFAGSAGTGAPYDDLGKVKK
jgi:hypothetical protein